MQIALALTLPRDELTIPVARHICRDALVDIGVSDGCTSDIELALTEACTNVLDHSGPGDEYVVQVSISTRECVIRVIDAGQGFDAGAVRGDGSMLAERGRGVQLMRALVDRLEFISRPEDGTIVRLEKHLELDDDGPGARLIS